MSYMFCKVLYRAFVVGSGLVVGERIDFVVRGSWADNYFFRGSFQFLAFAFISVYFCRLRFSFCRFFREVRLGGYREKVRCMLEASSRRRYWMQQFSQSLFICGYRSLGVIRVGGGRVLGLFVIFIFGEVVLVDIFILIFDGIVFCTVTFSIFVFLFYRG